MTACFARQPFPEGRTAREAIKNGHRLTDGRVERNTKQKELIHDALKANDEFISAQDLHRKLEDEGVKVGLATVYRQLNALAEAGEADTVRLEGQQLFRLCGDDGHHHHLVCTNCGKTVEIESPSETWLRGISEKYGFTIERHTLEVFGLCPDCRNEARRKFRRSQQFRRFQQQRLCGRRNP